MPCFEDTCCRFRFARGADPGNPVLEFCVDFLRSRGQLFSLKIVYEALLQLHLRCLLRRCTDHPSDSSPQRVRVGWLQHALEHLRHLSSRDRLEMVST